MNKKITLEQSKATCTGLASAGSNNRYIVIGHPYETEEDFQMTLDFVDEMKDYIWQAEPNPFYYHYTGQFGADDWKDKRMLLYPEEARRMLVFDTWTLNCEPLREERYERLHRFTAHCDKLGIPNPYTASEIHAADERWHKLHKNAVPSVWEFETWANTSTRQEMWSGMRGQRMCWHPTPTLILREAASFGHLTEMLYYTLASENEGG